MGAVYLWFYPAEKTEVKSTGPKDVVVCYKQASREIQERPREVKRNEIVPG
jgi:hypothetical protein